ncbi:UNVERIFIED_CONTAM: hypothetical protein RMT77_002230 [Armadillidium vulgare]
MIFKMIIKFYFLYFLISINQAQSTSRRAVKFEKSKTRNKLAELVKNGNTNQVDNCFLQDVMEEIKIDKKDGMIYFPPCFKVKKCSGYCFGMRKCRPTEIQSQTHHILEIKATSYSGITYKDVMTSPFIKTVVENHKKCQCDCAVLEHECRYPHQYNKMDCTCECSNK